MKAAPCFLREGERELRLVCRLCGWILVFAGLVSAVLGQEETDVSSVPTILGFESLKAAVAIVAPNLDCL